MFNGNEIKTSKTETDVCDVCHKTNVIIEVTAQIAFQNM